MSNQDPQDKDLADKIPEYVETALSTTATDASALDPQQDKKRDRSTVLAQDGKVLAGWALRFIVVVIALFIFFQLTGYVWMGILPIILALLLTTVLWPPTRWMRNHKVPGALAAIISLLGFFAILIGVGISLAPTVRSQGRLIVDQAAEGLNTIFDYIRELPIDFDEEIENFDADQFLDSIISFLRDQSGNIVSGVTSGISTAATIGTTVFIMLVVTFFMLKDGDRFLPMLRRHLGPRAGWHVTEILTRSWNTLSGYIQTQAIVSFVDAFLIGIGLVILQVPMALVLAVITFFAGFIPIVGAFTAGALAVIVALVTNGFTNALIVLIIILVVQQVEGNVLQPALQSKAMNLHAAVVLLSVTVGSALFGILGAFLAVPFAAVVNVWINYHSEMVGLRAGEITIDDVEVATAKGKSMSSREGFRAVRDQLRKIAARSPLKVGSTAASKSEDIDVARESAEPDLHDKSAADNEDDSDTDSKQNN